MASLIYNAFKKNIMNGVVGDLSAGGTTVKCMLVTASYSPDQDAHEFVSSVTNEISGAGYTAGGATLASKTVTQDNTDNEGVWDAADTEWTSATFTTRAGVLYRDTGTPATSPLIAYIDFGADKSPENGTFKIQWNAEGILNLG